MGQLFPDDVIVLHQQCDGDEDEEEHTGTLKQISRPLQGIGKKARDKADLNIFLKGGNIPVHKGKGILRADAEGLLDDDGAGVEEMIQLLNIQIQVGDEAPYLFQKLDHQKIAAYA